MTSPRTSGRDLALVALAATAFATSSPLAKVAHGVAPLAIAAGRCAVAAVAISIGWPKGALSSLRALSPKHRVALPVAGLLLGGHLALFLAGLAHTSLAAAVSLVSLEPIAVVLAAWIAFGLRPTRGETLGLLVASAGAAIVASGAGSGEHRLSGDLLVVAGVAFFGAYVAFARGLRDAMPVMPYAGAVYFVAFAGLVPLALATQRGPGTLAGWCAVAAMGLVPTLVGHTIVQSVARRISPAIVGLVCPGETLGSIAIGALVLETRPSVREGIGAVVVIAGATLTVMGVRRE